MLGQTKNIMAVIMAVLLVPCTLLAQVCCSLMQRFIRSWPAGLFLNSKRAKSTSTGWETPMSTKVSMNRGSSPISGQTWCVSEVVWHPPLKAEDLVECPGRGRPFLWAVWIHWHDLCSGRTVPLLMLPCGGPTKTLYQFGLSHQMRFIMLFRFKEHSKIHWNNEQMVFTYKIS